MSAPLTSPPPPGVGVFARSTDVSTTDITFPEVGARAAPGVGEISLPQKLRGARCRPRADGTLASTSWLAGRYVEGGAQVVARGGGCVQRRRGYPPAWDPAWFPVPLCVLDLWGSTGRRGN